MSRSRFTERFAATYGQSAMAFVHTVRLKAAARLLQHSALPVKCVAAEVGYSSRSQFCRAFRRAFGADPSAFRRGTRAAVDPPRMPELVAVPHPMPVPEPAMPECARL